MRQKRRHLLTPLVLVVAAVQRGLIGAVSAVAIRIPRACAVGVGAGLAQRGMGYAFGVGQPAFVFNPRQAGLHIVELRCSHRVLVLSRQNAGNLFLRVQDAIRSLGMVAEGLGHQARLAFFKCLYLLKET